MASLPLACFCSSRGSKLVPRPPDAVSHGPERAFGQAALGAPLYARRALARLILFLAQYLPGFQIDQMHAAAGGALKRLIGVIIVGHLIGGPSLHVLAGVWPAI